MYIYRYLYIRKCIFVFVCAGTVMGAHSEHPEYSPEIHVQNRFITLYRYTSVNTLLVTKLDALKMYLFGVTLFVIAYHIFFRKTS